MKIVINGCYGGFGLSEEALRRYAELKGLPFYIDRSHAFPRYFTIPVEDANVLYTRARLESFSEAERTEFWDQYNAVTLSDLDIPRDDETLVQVVEELGGDDASGAYAELRIVEIPDGVNWEISDYDGIETIEEVHRSWF